MCQRFRGDEMVSIDTDMMSEVARTTTLAQRPALTAGDVVHPAQHRKRGADMAWIARGRALTGPQCQRLDCDPCEISTPHSVVTVCCHRLTLTDGDNHSTTQSQHFSGSSPRQTWSCRVGQEQGTDIDRLGQIETAKI